MPSPRSQRSDVAVCSYGIVLAVAAMHRYEGSTDVGDPGRLARRRLSDLAVDPVGSWLAVGPSVLELLHDTRILPMDEVERFIWPDVPPWVGEGSVSAGQGQFMTESTCPLRQK
ncbi:hypothetical protein BOTBODRAFT_582816 [Botryobasidium botryosum FD-172 SS1]|uniref:Uncharacterized protein n=1 Tax=Botryobasidium botryosum (strain FD-172 SS1) TaxID=930990 RepID=A0A067MQC8_BOTB1|nr:hypothetical protein BOTBODRAFT_582816 [Botryobasidium botryosum FD-172 SS1]